MTQELKFTFTSHKRLYHIYLFSKGLQSHNPMGNSILKIQYVSSFHYEATKMYNKQEANCVMIFYVLLKTWF